VSGRLSRHPLTFRQRDVAAAIKAAKAAGCEVARIKVDKEGQITLILSNGKEKPLDEPCRQNEWDEILRCPKSS
jgi:hypothetical protein